MLCQLIGQRDEGGVCAAREGQSKHTGAGAASEAGVEEARAQTVSRVLHHLEALLLGQRVEQVELRGLAQGVGDQQPTRPVRDAVTGLLRIERETPDANVGVRRPRAVRGQSLDRVGRDHAGTHDLAARLEAEQLAQQAEAVAGRAQREHGVGSDVLGDLPL